MTAPGSARPDWMIAAELATRLGRDIGASTLAGLWAEIETVSPLHQGVSRALLISRQARNGVVVPIGPVTSGPEAIEAPAPLDPMADPGILSAEPFPLPPQPPSIIDAEAPSAASLELTPPKRLELRAMTPDAAPSPPTVDAGAVAAEEGRIRLRLVTSRPMWDGGALIQHSPSLASLHPPVELRANPDDLARLGVHQPRPVRVNSRGGQAGFVVTATADAGVAQGAAVLAFNIPGKGAGDLIDASAAYTEVDLEKVEGP